MTDQSAFNEEKAQETPAQAPEQVNAFANQLEAIKNEEGKPKYDSVEKALEALSHSQEYIPQLKAESESMAAELAELKEKLAGNAAIEDVVARLQNTNVEQPPAATPAAPGVSEADILKVVEQFSQKREAETAATQNETAVSNKLFEMYGDRTHDTVTRKATELGMTVESIQSLSRTSPAAALALFGGAVQAPASPTTPGRTPALAPQEEAGLQPPTKSLLRGASTKEQTDYLKKIRENVYKKYDVQQ